MSRKRNPYNQIRKLKKSLRDKDAIIHQYQVLYEESRQALKLIKSGIQSSSDDLDSVIDDSKILHNPKP